MPDELVVVMDRYCSSIVIELVEEVEKDVDDSSVVCCRCSSADTEEKRRLLVVVEDDDEKTLLESTGFIFIVVDDVGLVAPVLLPLLLAAKA